jgi:transposase
LTGAGWHTAEALAVPDNMTLVPLPPYAPELNPTEHVWDELREKYFHNHVFESIDSLEDHLEASLRELESDKERIRSIVAWPWIVNAVMV